MWFSWEFLLNMLENDDSNLQTKFGMHITSNIFKIMHFFFFFFFFFAKVRGKDELKGTWSNFTPWLCIFEHRGKNSLGVFCNPSCRELELKDIISHSILSIKLKLKNISDLPTQRHFCLQMILIGSAFRYFNLFVGQFTKIHSYKSGAINIFIFNNFQLFSHC